MDYGRGLDAPAQPAATILIRGSCVFVFVVICFFFFSFFFCSAHYGKWGFEKNPVSIGRGMRKRINRKKEGKTSFDGNVDRLSQQDEDELKTTLQLTEMVKH